MIRPVWDRLRQRIALLPGIVLWAVLLPIAVCALDLRPGQSITDLGSRLLYASDPAADLGTMLGRFRDGGFSPDLDARLLETNYAPEAWGAVEIFNDTISDGRAPDPFAISLYLPVVSEVDIYIVRQDGLTENLLQYSIFAPFDGEQHSVTRLRTPVFQLAPQERITLMVNFKFGPFQSFKMALETPQDLEESAFLDGIWLAAFYAFSLACMLFFVGFFMALKDWISLLYAALFLMGLGVIAFVDGLLFRFFYPNAPEAQSLVGFFLIFALSGSGFLLAAQGFSGEGSRRAARVMLGLAVLSLIGFLASLASPGTFVAVFAYALAGVMPVAVLLGTGAWRKRQGRADTTAWWLAVIVAVSITAVFAALIFGWRSDSLHIMGAIRAIYVILLIATITNFAAHILFIRRQHALEVAAKLAALEAEAKRSQELLEAEQNYSRARDLAQMRQRQLATASHDFRQPLASLRMTMDSVGKDLDPALRARLAEAFDYMETLTGDYLDQTTGEADPPAPSQEHETEAYPLSMILQTVWQMFHEEAISKGLRLRACDSSLTVTVPAIVLMRIVSNLASNAVKYTESGGVLMGVRRRATGPEIWVCDTGAGLSINEINEFRQEGRKGAQSKGHGLGLAVCFGLAQDHGLDLTVSSQPGQGTVFRLSLPYEDQTRA